MKRTIYSTLALALLATPAAYSADLDGSVTIGGSTASVHGSQAKFNEYRTLGTGGNGSFNLDYRKDASYFKMDGSAVFIDNDTFRNKDNTKDLGFSIGAGITDQIKAYFSYSEIPHNITSNAKTFLNGVGTNTLTNPTPASNPTLASYTKTFDYSTKRAIVSGGMEMSLGTPFFFNAQVDRTKTDGLVPFAHTTSLREVPVPVDYTTTNLFLQTGYRGERLIATVDGLISGFNNENGTFATWNSTTSSRYLGYESPSSNYYKVGGSLTYNLPFWETVLMGRANYSMLRSDVRLFDDSTTASAQFLTPRDWNGKINYTTVSASVTSKPVKNLDTRIFINFLNKKNEGPEDFNYGSASYTTERFDYSKRNIGIDAGYKLPGATKLTGGYEYTNIHRAIREDAPSTDDHVMFIQAKNKFFKWMTGKVKYQHTIRTSEFANAAAINDPKGPFPATAPTVDSGTLSNYTLAFTRPIDTADKTQEAVKATLDFEPLHGLSLGLEYAYKRDDYTKNFLGIKNSDRHNLYFSSNYVNSRFTLTGYADLELVYSDSLFRQMARQRTATVAYLPDPFGPSDAANFNWTSKRRDINMAFGLTGEVPIIKDRLSAKVGYRYENANGNNDFTADNAAAVFNNQKYLDDYQKHAVDVKLAYSPVAALTLTGGYLYEHLKYTDDAWTGYTYIVGTNYLSGAYANPNYDASVFYVNASYKF